MQVRTSTPLSSGRFDLAHLRAIHAHVFQDDYEWAGRLRTVPLFKADSEFCRPEHLISYAREVFDTLACKAHLCGLTEAEFVQEAAGLLGDLNALHPFREGNGHSQRIFMQLLAERAGYPIVWPADMQARNSAASIASLRGDNRGLAELIQTGISQA